jgi:hypothetical protein
MGDDLPCLLEAESGGQLIELPIGMGMGVLWITVFHPFVSARASRAAEIEGLLDDLLGRDDVCVATLEEIAAHVRREVNGGLDHRVDALQGRRGVLTLLGQPAGGRDE